MENSINFFSPFFFETVPNCVVIVVNLVVFYVLESVACLGLAVFTERGINLRKHYDNVLSCFILGR